VEEEKEVDGSMNLENGGDHSILELRIIIIIFISSKICKKK